MKRTAVLFLLFIIGVIILADTGSLPKFIRVVYDFPNGDKLGHFILYGLLDFFLVRAFLSPPPSQRAGRVTLSVSLILSVVIALEEYSQRYFVSRTFSYLDLLASFLGVIVGGWAAYKIKRS